MKEMYTLIMGYSFCCFLLLLLFMGFNDSLCLVLVSLKAQDA